jgi:peptide deformylase
MSLFRILRFPEPVLLAAARPVEAHELNAELATTIDNMFETMRNAGGVGLAAPQVGISQRYFVMDIPESDDNPAQRHVFFNPEILHVEGEQIGEEGCLSFPGLFQTIRREMRVVVRASDVRGEPFELDLKDLAARCVLHETDHCDGIVFLDRMSSLKRELAKRRIKRLQNTGKWE